MRRQRDPDSGDGPYIVVAKWNDYQHYKDRDPIWIKNHVRLLAQDEYLALSGHRRAILHGLWMAYATSSQRLRGDTLSLSRRLNLKVSTADLKALSDAGFILIVASKALAERLQAASDPLALTRARALAEEEEAETTVRANGSLNPESSSAVRTTANVGAREPEPDVDSTDDDDIPF